MENFPADIAEYLKANVSNWFFLGPGLVMIVLELLDRVAGWKAPGKAYIHLVFTACLVGAMFLTWRDVYHDNQRLNAELKTVRNELDKPIVKDDGSKAIIADLQQQINRKDIEAQELKRLRDRAEDAEKRASSGIAALRSSLEDKEMVIRDLQGKTDDKIARNELKGKFLIYLQSTQIIKQNCLSGLKDYSPIKEFERWHDQTLRELRDLGDGSYMFRFAATPPPNASSHYRVDGKPVSEECNQVAKAVDIKQAVLKDFIAELSR